MLCYRDIDLSPAASFGKYILIRYLFVSIIFSKRFPESMFDDNIPALQKNRIHIPPLLENKMFASFT